MPTRPTSALPRRSALVSGTPNARQHQEKHERMPRISASALSCLQASLCRGRTRRPGSQPAFCARTRNHNTHPYFTPSSSLCKFSSQSHDWSPLWCDHGCPRWGAYAAKDPDPGVSCEGFLKTSPCVPPPATTSWPRFFHTPSVHTPSARPSQKKWPPGRPSNGRLADALLRSTPYSSVEAGRSPVR
jgi:hypothetical protein